jgi:Rrf2 family protein
VNVNTKLAVSLHMLVYLARHPGIPQSSATLASSIGTNPVVVRKLTQMLESKNLVHSLAGSKGGLLLTLPPEKISLWSVFCAVNGSEIFAIHKTSHPKCPVGSRMEPLLVKTFGDVEAGIEKNLNSVSIADLLTELSAKAHFAHP